jgi:hypothetical protein
MSCRLGCPAVLLTIRIENTDRLVSEHGPLAEVNPRPGRIQIETPPHARNIDVQYGTVQYICIKIIQDYKHRLYPIASVTLLAPPELLAC